MKRLSLYIARVSTDMIIVAENNMEAESAAKIYATDEIKDYCHVGLSRISQENEIPPEWKELYPYIANKCIDSQQQCLELFRIIKENEASNNIGAKKKKSKKSTDKVKEQLKPLEEDIKSPSQSGLPKLRF